MNLEQALEAILFHQAEPVSFTWLAQVLSVDTERVKQEAKNLQTQLLNRGIRLITTEDKLVLATAPEAADLLAKISKQDTEGDLSRAGLETLSLILYKQPITRAEIDYIRGVNSSFIVRHLTIRGLIERTKNPQDPRGYIYRPTTKLLAFMGLSDLSHLPQKTEITDKLKQFLTHQDTEETQ